MLQQRSEFTSEEVGEIVSIASELDRRTESERLTWDQLVDLANELGISRGTLAAAFRIWNDGRSQAAAENRRQNSRAARAARRAERFRGHTITYVIVVSGLALLDWLSGPGWWVQWIAVPWGILLTRQGVRLGMFRRALAR